MRSRGIMLEDTMARLEAIMSTPIVLPGGPLPPPAPTSWERALARRDRLVPSEVRERLELDRIDRRW